MRRNRGMSINVDGLPAFGQAKLHMRTGSSATRVGKTAAVSCLSLGCIMQENLWLFFFFIFQVIMSNNGEWGLALRFTGLCSRAARYSMGNSV